MLKVGLLSVMLHLQNQNIEPLKLEVACGKIKQNKKGIKINDQIKHKIYTWITHHPQVFQ